MPHERRTLSPLELQLAEQLVKARLHAVTLTAFDAVDCGPLAELHAQLDEAFQLKHGLALTPLPFWIKAAARALDPFPQLRTRLDGDEQAIGLAADLSVEINTPAGRFQPVIRDCAQTSISDLASRLSDLTTRAAANALTVSELQGGAMTLIVYNADGPDNSIPALAAPQSLTLAIHPVRHRVVASGCEAAIRPLAKLALSYDARIITAADAAAYLATFRSLLQTPVGLLLE